MSTKGNIDSLNMKEKNLNDWEEFEEEIKRLENERRKLEFRDIYLYRGHEKKSYHLETTLERYTDKKVSLKEYYSMIYRASYEIQSFGEDNWEIPSKSNFEDWLTESNGHMQHAWSRDFHRIYSYMVYLRHYGFPSPLLDWTISPYIAAYFAFRNIIQKKEDVSIYIYLEKKREFKTGGDDAYIRVMGPYIKTDQRHFIQQSRYTMCIMREPEPQGEWHYAPHMDAFNRCDQNQDILWKFNIPNNERLKVLKLLDRFNINAFSLFKSKESLMETMAFRQIFNSLT
jgi:hypothetical protein